ncbi:uncharacterized protein LOC105423494 [Pogonomyrmex barbatus]|uniref:Uncharacterized protein LOC105423494 n=1 Tax=Pogonomyrmex barbatus TaxID=144034 RepID=A0A6I9VZQ7_9HYME|nr:uncharacterized protein LOC105423494 [Pogonomyrmex barbatus]
MVISQKHLNIAECENIIISTDKYENDYVSVSTIEKVEIEGNEKGNENHEDETISIIDKETQKYSKEKRSYILCFGNIHHISGRVFKSTKGSSKDLKQSPCKKRMFSLLDTLISTCIVGPLTIGFWRGIWTSMDRHPKLFPSWVCFVFGAILHIIYMIFKGQFHNMFITRWSKLNSRKRLPYRALRILYTYTFGMACIAHWRGGWIIIDNYLFMHIWITISLTCSLLACLVIFRCIRNLIATPLITIIDIPNCIFQFPTRYNVTEDSTFYNCDYINATFILKEKDWKAH